jgi:PAS domain S-box-containing protein
MLERLYRLVLPQALLDDETDIRVSRFVVLVTSVLAFFLFTAFPVLYWYLNQKQVAIVILLAALGYLASLAMPRLTNSIRLTSMAVVAGNLLGLLALIVLYYPQRAVFYVWFPFTILLTTFGLGRRWGAVLVGVLMPLIWQVELAQVHGLITSSQTLDSQFALPISFSLAMFMTGVLAWLFEFAHRTAQQRLFASEAKLRLHVQQTPLAVITSSLEGIVTEWNPGAERMFGYLREEALGHSLEKLIGAPQGETGSAQGKPAAQLFEGDDAAHQIGRNRTKQGQGVYCEWINTPLVAKDGSIVGITSLAIDVGERMRAEEAMRASEARFRRLTAQSPDLIVIYDWEVERIVYTNRDTVVGYSWQEITTLSDMLAHILPDDREGVYRSWRAMEFAPEGQETNVQEFRVIAADDSLQWIRSRESVITRDAQGLPVQLLATLTIITDEKNYEAELRRAKEEAERLARARSQFLANMSHEIRTPMNGIIGMTSLLMNAEMNEEQYDFIETIRSSSESLLTIINEVLDFSKIESGRMELEMQPFDLQESIEGALDLLAPQAANKYLEVGYWMDDSVPTMVVGDATRLRQILVNLLANAVKFTERGEVWVNVSRSQRTDGTPLLHFAVSDTGIGIRQSQIPQLFTAFSQLDNSTTRRYGGTGLGLAISRRLAELMGGAMWVESKVGAGSTFYFTVVAEAVQDSPIPLASDGATGNGVTGNGVTGDGVTGDGVTGDGAVQVLKDRCVLIVAHNGRCRSALEGYAQRWQMKCLSAVDAREAMEVVKGRQDWDVALVDMDLPDEEGLSLLGKMKSLPATQDKPLVLLASRNHANIRQRAEQAGAASTLYKPLKHGDLLAALASALGAELAEEGTTAGRISTLDHEMGREHPLHILLAEDNVVNQKVALLLLDRLGYRADVAASGHEVVQAVRRQRYDVILMDVHMPDMDGIEATRQVFGMLPPGEHPYIVAMTAAAMQEDRERCRAVGMHNFISKPVKVEELVRSLLQARTWLLNRIAA